MKFCLLFLFLIVFPFNAVSLQQQPSDSFNRTSEVLQKRSREDLDNPSNKKFKYIINGLQQRGIRTGNRLKSDSPQREAAKTARSRIFEFVKKTGNHLKKKRNNHKHIIDASQQQGIKTAESLGLNETAQRLKIHHGKRWVACFVHNEKQFQDQVRDMMSYPPGTAVQFNMDMGNERLYKFSLWRMPGQHLNWFHRSAKTYENMVKKLSSALSNERIAGTKEALMSILQGTIFHPDVAEKFTENFSEREQKAIFNLGTLLRTSETLRSECVIPIVTEALGKITNKREFQQFFTHDFIGAGVGGAKRLRQQCEDVNLFLDATDIFKQEIINNPARLRTTSEMGLNPKQQLLADYLSKLDDQSPEQKQLGEEPEKKMIQQQENSLDPQEEPLEEENEKLPQGDEDQPQEEGAEQKQEKPSQEEPVKESVSASRQVNKRQLVPS